ncbi:MAG: hypothetical protein ACT4QC_19415 [Planctomycetaceae bacterium]
MSLSTLKSVRLGLIAAAYLGFATICAHALLTSQRSRIDIFLALVVATFVSLACVADARILRRPLACPVRAALFFFWPIALPVYLLWSRGWWGLAIVLIHGTVGFGVVMICAIAAVLLGWRL